MTHLTPLAARLQLAIAEGHLFFMGSMSLAVLTLKKKVILSFLRIQLGFLSKQKLFYFRLKFTYLTVQKRLQSNITWGKGILTQSLLSQQYFSSRKQQSIHCKVAASGGEHYSADPTLHTIRNNRFRKSIHQLQAAETLRTKPTNTIINSVYSVPG